MPGLPNFDQDFRTLWLTEMNQIIDDLRTVFSGKIIIGAVATVLDGTIADKIDAMSITLNIGGITNTENQNLSVEILKSKYKALIQEKYVNISSQIGKSNINLPVIWHSQVQSKYDFYVTQWSESFYCSISGSNPCIQQTYIPDFSVQAIGTEAIFEAIIEQPNFKTDAVNIDAGYWPTDDMVPRADGQTGFPNLHQSVRNKPAEEIVKYWFSR